MGRGGVGGGADTSKDKVNKVVATLEVKKEQSLRKMYNVKRTEKQKTSLLPLPTPGIPQGQSTTLVSVENVSCIVCPYSFLGVALGP